ncbi:MAG: glycosyltransferase [Fimbriimonadales bacterium]|nr:glycosyltransferase [Fimbriimonadales bacterium]
MPRVSVLLTCYNHRPFLQPCLEGLFGQTFRDLEVVAIDDGSTDGTRELLSEETRIDRLILTERNLGTYAALNLALEASRGEFVAILNDDDLWDPRKLERQLELFEAHPELGLVHTDGWFMDAEGRRLEGSPLGFEFPRTTTGDALVALLYANKIIASAVLVRRECFDRVGSFDPAYFGSGDWHMWLRIAERWNVGYVDEPLTFYRLHGSNASHRLERIWRDDERLRLWIRDRYAAYLSSGRDRRELRKAFSHNEACLGTVQMLNGKPAEARRSYARSLRWAPWRLKSALRLAATFLPPRLFRRLL